jgi:hypothetical protein
LVQGHELNSTTLSGSWKKVQLDAVHDFRRFANQRHEVRNFLVLACEVVGELFPDLDKGVVQEVLEYHDAEFADKDIEQLTTRSEPEDENRDAVVENSLPTRLQMMDDLLEHYFEDYHHMDRYLTLKPRWMLPWHYKVRSNNSNSINIR